jgi:hypothetical protein
MAVRSQTSEHILLEAEERAVPAWDRARITHAAWQRRSRLRLHRLELAIIDYYYLAVRTRRSGSRHEYVLDLRCVERSMRARRHIAWKWLLATLALASIAAFGTRAVLAAAALHGWPHRLLLCAAAFGSTAGAGLVCAWRTTETLSLRSLHGGVTLLEFTGGLGTLRSSRTFARKLAAHIQLALADRKSRRAEFLRDEMREHFRLREAGVLSQEQYEASKARILAAHTRIPRRPRPE